MTPGLRFCTFDRAGLARPGVLWRDDAVVDLVAAVARYGPAGPPDARGPAWTFPADMLGLIREAEAALPAVRTALDRLARGAAGPDADLIVPLRHARLLAPIPWPAKNLFCVGRNYRDHVAEGYRARGQQVVIPEHPEFFTKPATAVVGPEADIPLDPTLTRQLDYEAELAVVIGRTGKDIRREEALDHVFGYTILNDVTARDLQRRHGQWFKGKALDGCCPMGPVILHASAVPDPHGLSITLRVNGEVRQAGNTRDMIFDIPAIIEALSRGMTLHAGDIIATGTPGGVGYARTPPAFLRPGDVVEVEVERLGVLRNRVRLVAAKTTATGGAQEGCAR